MADTHDPQTSTNGLAKGLFWVLGLALLLVLGWHATGVAQCYARGGAADISLGGVTCMIPLPPEGLTVTS